MVVWRPDRSPAYDADATPDALKRTTGTRKQLATLAWQNRLAADLHDSRGRYVGRITDEGEIIEATAP